MTYFNSLLTSTDKRGVNWLPFYESPGVVTFLYAFVRMNFLIWIPIFIVAAPFYFSDNFGSLQKIGYPLVIWFVFWEEQTRWLFASNSSHPIRSAVTFFILIVAAENMLFWTSFEGEFSSFLYGRIPSIIIHAFSTLVLISSLKCDRIRLFFGFLIALFSHSIFNFFA